MSRPIRLHPRVQHDIDDAMDYYQEISERVADGFWQELNEAFSSILENPERHHFDPSGLRRCNLDRYPFHILYQALRDRVRVQVVKHNSRHPSFGLRRKRG